MGLDLRLKGTGHRGEQQVSGTGRRRFAVKQTHLRATRECLIGLNAALFLQLCQLTRVGPLTLTQNDLVLKLCKIMRFSPETL